MQYRRQTKPRPMFTHLHSYFVRHFFLRNRRIPTIHDVAIFLPSLSFYQDVPRFSP